MSAISSERLQFCSSGPYEHYANGGTGKLYDILVLSWEKITQRKAYARKCGISKDEKNELLLMVVDPCITVQFLQ